MKISHCASPRLESMFQNVIGGEKTKIFFFLLINLFVQAI